MARNKMNDLRNHLFAQLENLADDELMLDENRKELEIQRSKSMVEIAKAITETAKVEIIYISTVEKLGSKGIDVSFVMPTDEQKKIS